MKLSIPCENVLTCPTWSGRDDDWPVQNWTSEDPDRLLFIGLNWGWGFDVPPLGSDWQHSHCLGTCYSSVSQEDADLCAALMQFLCIVGPGIDPGTGDGGGGVTPITPPVPQTPVYYNTVQACEWDCGDGSFTVFTVQAGTFVSTSQEQANQMAYSYACRNVRRNRICVSNINGSCCVDTFAEFTIHVTTGTFAPHLFSLISGSLPEGMTLQQIGPSIARVSGLSYTAGIYNFTLRCTSAIGNTVDKDCVIRVIGLQDTILPNATVGTAYLEQLQAIGGVAPYTFALAPGSALPDGLTLASNGTISGTPTTPDP